MNKKERELEYLERFRERFPEFPSGHVEAHENPDFLVSTDKGMLGIEIVNLYRPTRIGHRPMQEQESLRWRTLEAAKTLYDSEGHVSAQVNVLFNAQHVLRKSDVKPLAKQIVGLVVENTPERGVTYIEVTEHNWESFPPAVQTISVLRNKALTKSYWLPTDGGVVPTLESGLIQAALDGKNRRCSTYRTNCSELWAILVADGFAVSSMFDIPSDIAQHRFHAAFDKVFLYQHFGGKPVELAIDCPVDGGGG